MLRVEDRQFLNLVRQVVFANPFSAERVEAECRITGLSRSDSESRRLDAMIGLVNTLGARLQSEGFDNIRKVRAEDRPLLEYLILFDVFHENTHHFDRLIQDQLAAGDRSVPVPFARKIIQSLVKRGFSRPDAIRYLGLFYQMRRAYYFIHHTLVGRSRCMKQLRRSLWNNIFTHDIRLYVDHLWNRMEDFSTMLLGETGTGKGTAAAAIGRSGYIPFLEKESRFRDSFMRIFISLNLSQYPESLIESELFGHRKGSFTGAVDSHEGIFSRCSPHGAIFLDEIGEISPQVQIKLLQVLQERVYSPVGSHEKRRFNGRVIAATNQSLDALRLSGRFRDDFFYRLCSDVIIVPPLRQRIIEDITELDDLLQHTLARILGKASPRLVRQVLAVMRKQLPEDYSWPGNVRELEQCVRRILLKNTYEGDSRILSTHLIDELTRGVRTYSLDANQLVSGYCRLLYNQFGTYQEVARRTGLDRRTAKKYIENWDADLQSAPEETDPDPFKTSV